jgi:serine/threonine protein kinase
MSTIGGRTRRHGDGVSNSEHSGREGHGNDCWQGFLLQLRSRRAAFARYEYRGEIARGGMGVVHLVHDVDTMRTLALKVMRPPERPVLQNGAPISSGTLLSRFIEEAQITSQLDHPGIVPVHEIGVDAEDRPYFTMKHVEGETLKTIFDKGRIGVEGWGVTRIVHVLLKVCEAMEYAHWKGVIHRDLKPANIMVGRFGEVYVMDWGLARLLGREEKPGSLEVDPSGESPRHVRTVRRGHRVAKPGDPELTVNGDVVGTPAYMAPEQARADRRSLGPHSDVYAIGAMLYHLLTGYMPYTAGAEVVSPQDIVDMLVCESPDPIDALVSDAPPELVAICEKAMQRKIENRYPSMNALAADLRAYLENRVVGAFASGRFATFRKWVDRNRIFAGTVAVLVTAVSIFGSAEAFRLRSQRDDALVKLDLAESALTEARSDEFAARELALAANLALDDLAPYADLRRLATLRHEFARLDETEPNLAAYESWLASARDLISRRDEHALRLTALRSDPEDATADDLTLALAIEDLLAGLDMLNSRDHAGASIAAAAARLESLETSTRLDGN